MDLSESDVLLSLEGEQECPDDCEGEHLKVQIYLNKFCF